jgi:hypothetical protein
VLSASAAASITLACLLLAGCAAHHEVELDLTSRRPLACIEGDRSTDLVVGRTQTAANRSRDLVYVFDFVTMTGFPRCGAGSIADFCTGDACALSVEDRRCVRVPREHLDAVLAAHPGELPTPIEVVPDEALGALLADAPDGPLLIRLVATMEDASGLCDGAAIRRFDPDLVVGCAYSCPVVLDDAREPIPLDLDPSFGPWCTFREVEACAQFLLSP